MGAKKSPQLAKSKVVGTRLNPNELAFVDIARGNQTASAYVAGLVRKAKAEWEKQQQTA